MIKYKLSSNNLHLYNSYEVRKRNIMERDLIQISNDHPDHYVFEVRTIKSMIREWRAHNLMYDLHFERERTKDCDLNAPQKWYVKVIYFVLSLFYIA